jgi:hypothetical protein
MPWINARYSSRCAECDAPLAAGDRCWWDADTRKVYCATEGCGELVAAEDPAPRRTSPRAGWPYCPDCRHAVSAHGPSGCAECPCLRKA